jgi:hypothetical protein
VVVDVLVEVVLVEVVVDVEVEVVLVEVLVEVPVNDVLVDVVEDVDVEVLVVAAPHTTTMSSTWKESVVVVLVDVEVVLVEVDVVLVEVEVVDVLVEVLVLVVPTDTGPISVSSSRRTNSSRYNVPDVPASRSAVAPSLARFGLLLL